MNRFFIITGGPGSGKTTLISALDGIHRMPEAGRAVIQDELAAGGSALPWRDPLAFAEKMLERDIASWEAARVLDGPVIFDRGIPDIVGYLRLTGTNAPTHMVQAAAERRYNNRVFIAPPWREIFTQDAERKQTFAEAEATYQAMREIYTELGYEMFLLPLASIEARAAFVRSALI
jgi:predicted ATPase